MLVRPASASSDQVVFPVAASLCVASGNAATVPLRFARYSPWSIEVDNVEGVAICNMVLRDGDLVASEDLATALRKGECRIEAVETPKGIEHQFLDKKGKRWSPKLPWINADL